MLNAKLSTFSFDSHVILKADISDVYYKNVLYTQTKTQNLLSSKLTSEIVSYYNNTYIDNLITSYYTKKLK